MLGAINVGLKAHPIGLDLSELGQTKNLKTSGISQNRPLPIHKFMEATRSLHQLVPWTKIEMVGVPKNNFGTALHQISRQHGLHRTSCAHRHENWRIDIATRRRNFAQTCTGARNIVLYIVKLDRHGRLRLPDIAKGVKGESNQPPYFMQRVAKPKHSYSQSTTFWVSSRVLKQTQNSPHLSFKENLMSVLLSSYRTANLAAELAKGFTQVAHDVAQVAHPFMTAATRDQAHVSSRLCNPRLLPEHEILGLPENPRCAVQSIPLDPVHGTDVTALVTAIDTKRTHITATVDKHPDEMELLRKITAVKLSIAITLLNDFRMVELISLIGRPDENPAFKEESRSGSTERTVQFADFLSLSDLSTSLINASTHLSNARTQIMNELKRRLGIGFTAGAVAGYLATIATQAMDWDIPTAVFITGGLITALVTAEKLPEKKAKPAS